MISSDFYPTTYTYANGELELTNDIKNLMSTENLGSPYYMGYILHDDFPECLKVKKVNFANGLSYEPIESNHSWGLWYNRAAYNTSSRTTSYQIFQNGSDYLPTSTSLIYCFVNKIKMANVNYINAVTINVVGIYIPTDDLDDTGNTGFKTRVGSIYFEAARPITSDLNISNTISIERLKSIVDGDTPLIESWTYSINNGHETISRTFPDVYVTDFNENGLLKVVCNEGDYMFIGSITNFDPIDRGALSYLNTSQAQSIVSGVPTPFFESDIDDTHIIYNRGYQQYLDARLNYYYQLKILRAPTNVYTEFHQENYCFDRFPEFKLSTFDIPTPSDMYNKSAVVDNDYFLTPTGSGSGFYQFRIYPKHDLADIYKFLMYYHKIQLTAHGLNQLTYNPTYTTDISVSLFNDNDQSDNERVADNYANISDQLRDWQQPDTDIAVNEYDPADKPEYEPSGDEDEESGTRIPNQFRYFTGANNFISQYAMKASQIQTFGQMLWNSWAESTTFVDAVNNFWIALNIENFTGSFDISSVMNFIVSLKVFPFNITHFDTNTFILTDTLRIGRGTFPFLFPSEVGNIIKVLSNIVYVDCGLIHDPTTGQYGIPRKFNDFRDYTNVSITCFCPYCGTVELNPGDVVGRQLSCKYAVDLQTGECLCLITVADSTGDLYNVAAISGNMGANIPVSATNSGLIEARRLSDAGNALGLFGGMFTENLSMGSNTFAKAKDSQSSIGAIASASTQAASNLFKDIKQTSNFAANMLSRGAIGCPMMQGGSGFAAFSQADTPYVQIRYGIYSEPANYSHSVGRISTKSDVLSSYKDSGLVICENVDVSGFTCHEDERTEIKALLESGVYL